MIIVLILAGSSVAVVGAVSFVGLIIPHVTRFLVGVDYRWIIPCSAILGSLLVVFADLAARMINPPYEAPIGALIALIGVPFFLYLARNERRSL
ncbi:Iron-uptake system permease protein FeuB [compost metagenome]